MHNLQQMQQCTTNTTIMELLDALNATIFRQLYHVWNSLFKEVVHPSSSNFNMVVDDMLYMFYENIDVLIDMKNSSVHILHQMVIIHMKSQILHIVKLCAIKLVVHVFGKFIIFFRSSIHKGKIDS